MKIKYSFGDLEKTQERERVDFMLTSRKGGYFYSNSRTRYGGFFIYDKDMLKVIDNLVINAPRVEEVVSELYQVKRKRGDVEETFFLPWGSKSLVYELNKKMKIDLLLDIRASYDGGGRRAYKVYKKGKKTIVECETKEGIVYLVVSSLGEEVCSWRKAYYEDDEKRNSEPYNLDVYDALILEEKRVVFSASLDKKEAMNENDYISKKLKKIKNQQKNYFRRLQEGELGEVLANFSLGSLFNQFLDERFFAGLPWFFQNWSRDELIALRGLILMGEEGIVKKILFNYLEKINKEGNLVNHEKGDLAAADGVGWLFLRFKELLDSRNLDEKEREVLKEKLEGCIEKLRESRTTEEGFAWNKEKETWMDTDWKGDAREGIRIEIQAMRLFMYRLAYELTGKKKYNNLEEELKKKVREKLFDGQKLADGLNDFRQRPNIFLAYYFYPFLLDDTEWEKVFDYALEKLWLKWGGLATIEKESELFKEEHTGERPESYHRGDAWFWINNLAALVMYDLNDLKYRYKVRKILKASLEEMHWSGCLGCCAELCSAKELRSEGCVNQAWSASTLLELLFVLGKVE